MTKKSDDEVLIDALIDTLAALEQHEAALCDLRVKLEVQDAALQRLREKIVPTVNRLHRRWRSQHGEA